MVEEEKQEREGDSEDTNTVAYIEERRDTPLLEQKDIVAVGNLGYNKYDEGIEWLDVEEPLDLVKYLQRWKTLGYSLYLKDPETPLLVGRGFLATANAVIDCRMAKIAVGEGITRSVFRVKGVDLGEEEAPYWTTLGKRESYKPRPRSEGVGA
ncbi:hypothetical protein Tco_0226759 [Tanacetum coccineum]